MACGSLPVAGGQNEIVAFLRRLNSGARFDRLRVRSIRTDHEYWLLTGASPVLVTALRRRRRGVKLMRKRDEVFARLNGRDYLQYEREAHFNPRAGELRMRFRLNGEVPQDGPRVLFNTGIGVGRVMGSRVNKLLAGGHGWKCVDVCRTEPAEHLGGGGVAGEDRTRQVARRRNSMGRFQPKGRQSVHRDRSRTAGGTGATIPAVFGELGVDSQNLESRSEPRTFYIKSNTVLAFGGAVQMPGTGVKCDLASVDLKCPGRRAFASGFREGHGAGNRKWGA